jgi:hypothetical protein
VDECEDGVIMNSDRVCAHCQQPDHRFIPGIAGRSSDQTRATALAAMREALGLSPTRTTTAASRRPPARATNPAAFDRALEQARARLADPRTPRMTEPPPLPNREQPTA